MQGGDWGSYYADAASVDHFLTNLYHHREFVAELLALQPQRALEAGCGTAGMSVLLAMAGVQATACDVDESVLGVARQNATQWNAGVDVIHRDIFELSKSADRYDVVFSQGVLEHFDDDRIHALVRESLAVAPAFMFSVPTRYYGHRDFGDERLMTLEEWQEILAPTGDARLSYYFPARRRYSYFLRRPLMLKAVVKRA
jgi:SAM-dependent methyltransferase